MPSTEPLDAADVAALLAIARHAIIDVVGGAPAPALPDIPARCLARGASFVTLTIEGELDDISGPGQTQAAHDLCAGIPIDKKQDFVVPGVGHYGIFSGRRWREQIYPCVRDFIRANT